MYKTVLETERNNRIDLEYDNQKYEIEYVKRKNMIILKRISDSKILDIFSDKIGFIVQQDGESQTNFLVTDYSDLDKGEKKSVKFKHFVDYGSSDALYLEKEFNCNSIWLSDCRINDGCYIVEQSGYGGCIYNLNKKSKRFDNIYHDERINSILGDNILLVSREIDSHSRIKDTITYGINLNSFEIVTPIYSKLQQRYIPIYTKEQVDEINKEFHKKGQFIRIYDFSLEEITIYLEVTRYLELLDAYLEEPKEVYLDFSREKINEPFVKKFTPNK